MEKSKRTTLIAVVVFVVLATLFAGLYFGLKEIGEAGNKSITVTVVTDRDEKIFTIKTDEEFLLGALNQIDLIETEDSLFGAYVVEANGIKAEPVKNQFWEIIKNGQATMTGVSDTPVSDGDRFELRLSVY